MSGKDKPLVTFALFAYNQEQFVREAVTAALAQDYEPLEIIISDDCSSDSTFDVIREAVSGYDGPHNLILNLNESNLGLINHVNKVVSMSSGDLVVAAAGDDVSYSFRVATLAGIFYGTQNKPLLIHSPVEKISLEGKSLGIMLPPVKSSDHLVQIKEAPTMDSIYVGASGAWSKELFEIYGPMTHLAAYEDIVLGARAAMVGRIAYFPSPLLRYRIDSGITTNSEKFKSIRSFFGWRKDWIKTMESVYLQRIEDSAKVGLNSEKSSMIKKLELFSCKRSMYEGKAALIDELNSNPIRFIRCATSELGSITLALLRRIST